MANPLQLGTRRTELPEGATLPATTNPNPLVDGAVPELYHVGCGVRIVDTHEKVAEIEGQNGRAVVDVSPDAMICDQWVEGPECLRMVSFDWRAKR